jgi:hypothetical protein
MKYVQGGANMSKSGMASNEKLMGSVGTAERPQSGERMEHAEDDITEKVGLDLTTDLYAI